MSIRKIWNIKSFEVNQDILLACGGNRVLAKLLLNRNIDTVDKVNNFLNPLKSPLSSPDVFVDMQKSVDRIKSAIDKKENITIYGDFDCDGITSTSLLYLTLKQIGANVNYYLPNRATESHGLNTKALVNIIAKRKTKLIITVDCGISNVDEVKFANGFKTDVIITDHHEAPEVLPNAYAILNPKSPNALVDDLSIDEIQSLNYLAGVGVAFKLACKLLEMYSKENFVHEILPLVAVGSIGDVVELLSENRRLVQMGLELLRNGKHKGIQLLLKEAGIEDITSLTSDNIAFGVVPRLNAAGRLESPDTAIKLLISDDIDELNSTVKSLNDLNALRQDLCDVTFNQAKKMYLSSVSKHKKSIVLFSDDWHIGIIGIVASKLVEEFNKPTFLMTRDSNNTNIIRCSCRSIDAVNVHSILSLHKDLFVGFGGHKLAAGFSFDETKINFEQFKSILNKTIDENSQGVDFSSMKIEADMELDIDDITFENVEAINKMQPFGSANPFPLFVLNDLKLKSFRFMGSNNNHLKMFVTKDNVTQLQCVKWNFPDFNLPENSSLDILFSPSINTFNGESNIQLMINDIHSDLLNQKIENNEIKIIDHRNKTNIIIQVLDFISSTKKSTAIFLQNQALKKKLSLPDEIEDKIFNLKNIPADIYQIMLFECPLSYENLNKIIGETGASVVHLMNFGVEEINTDNLITKLSGMLKYAKSNLAGKLDLYRLSSALCVDVETIDCALSLFENVEMIDLDKISDEEYIINSIDSCELSKLKQDDLYFTLEEKIYELNNFKKMYLNLSVDEIKSKLFE